MRGQSLSSRDVLRINGDKTAQARETGTALADAAKAAGISRVVFDRGGNTYTGRVAAFADAAREGGLEF